LRSGHWTTALKALFLVLIFAILIRQDLLSLESIETAISRWPWVLGGWACMFATTVVAIIRWHFLVRAQGIPIPLRRTVQSAFVGLFFNVFLPGSLSGDLVKGYYIARAVPGHTAAAVSSILFDRVVGMSGLIALAAIALVIGSSSGGEWAGMLGAPVIFAVVGVFTGVSIFYAALLGVDEERDPILKLVSRMAERLTFLNGPLSVYRGVRVYHEKRVVTLSAIGISIIAHASLVAAWMCFVMAMDLQGIPLPALFVVVPVGMLVAAIPIGPAGIGTGHAAFLAIFAMLGSDRGADLFNLVLAYQFIQAGFGGIVYLSIKANDPIAMEEMQSAMSDGESAEIDTTSS
jgi:uncharacterized protein (TIRG00374 family)